MIELLKHLRLQVDTIDDEIIYLLSRRFELIKQIAKIKKENKLVIYEPERADEVMENVFEEAEDKGVSKEVVEALWKIIIEEAGHILKED